MIVTTIYDDFGRVAQQYLPGTDSAATGGFRTVAAIKMNRDPEVMEYFPKQLTESETLAMINRINPAVDNNGFGLWTVEDRFTKEFLGFIGFSVPQFESFFAPCVEIGWRYKKKELGDRRLRLKLQRLVLSMALVNWGLLK